ncbi:MAG TPA: CGGC domain-containing protein, partial [Candidatus Methanoperedens sp.]|nr:CGGC domain-containing protein [Candidatus Methanoperedens sp.]
MEWKADAIKELEKVPENVRNMAKMGIETAVEKKGENIVTLKDVNEAAAQFRAIMEKEEKTTKIAVVRCDIVSETCPGVACFKAFNKRKVHFEQYGKDAQIIGFFTCGGCPGRRIFRLVDSLLKHDVDVVHLSSCMLLEKSYAKCPHIEEIKQMITVKGVKIV